MIRRATADIMVKFIRAAVLSGFVAACPSAVLAQRAPVDLAFATLEELMDIRVTSVARKSQRAEDVPAALYVITREDIRQSGLMTLPEILRLAPGVQVAQISASKWAVAIRGFNNLHSNSLLVLIDGRTVYSRTYSGVFWELQDVIVGDIDRIEVIRGPGGVAWGANAVNGVINVITRPAAATQGLALEGSVGTFARERAAIRYGGMIGQAPYRAFAQWSRNTDSEPAAALPYSDRWHSLTSGARVDWSGDRDEVLVQGHLTTNRTRQGWLALSGPVPGQQPSTDGESISENAVVLARWTRTRAAGSVFQLQTYQAYLHRDEPISRLTERTTDVEAQYETRVGARHGVVLGGGYRYVDLSSESTFTVTLQPARIHKFSAFVEDEIALGRRVALMLGSKLERDTFAGWGLLPSARVIWEATPGQHLWAAVSRTRRTPSVSERTVRLNAAVVDGPGLPIVFGFTGNPQYRSERLLQTEGGYRVRLGATAAVDATIFSGSFDGLATQEPLAPTVATVPTPYIVAGLGLANLLDARMSGVEINARWNPLPQWKLETSYTHLHLTSKLHSGSLDAGAAQSDGNSPTHQVDARTAITLRPGLEVSASLWRVGRLRQLAVPAYTRLDARAEVRLRRQLTAAVVVQNLLHGHHQEFASTGLFLTSRTPRSARLDIRWGF